MINETFYYIAEIIAPLHYHTLEKK